MPLAPFLMRTKDKGTQETDPGNTLGKAFGRDDVRLFQMLAPWGIGGGLLIAMSFIASDQIEHLPLKASESVKWTLEFSKSLLLEVGIALIVSCFVAGTIERLMRIRAKEEASQDLQEIKDKRDEAVSAIQDNVFRHLFGFNIEKVIMEELYQTIFATKLVRRDLRLTYEFNIFSNEDGDQTDLMRVNNTVVYEVHNLSDEQVKLPIIHYFENVIRVDGFSDSFKEFRIEEIKAGPNNVLVSLDAAQCAHRATTEGIRKRIELDGQIVHPGQPLKISFMYEAVRRLSDTELWVTTLPTEGFTIQAIVDDRLPDLDIKTDSAHRDDLRIDKLPGVDSHGKLRIYEWSFSSGILPYQGAVLFWFPKSLIEAGAGAKAAPRPE